MIIACISHWHKRVKVTVTLNRKRLQCERQSECVPAGERKDVGDLRISVSPFANPSAPNTHEKHHIFCTTSLFFFFFFFLNPSLNTDISHPKLLLLALQPTIRHGTGQPPDDAGRDPRQDMRKHVSSLLWQQRLEEPRGVSDALQLDMSALERYCTADPASLCYSWKYGPVCANSY